MFRLHGFLLYNFLLYDNDALVFSFSLNLRNFHFVLLGFFFDVREIILAFSRRKCSHIQHTFGCLKFCSSFSFIFLYLMKITLIASSTLLYFSHIFQHKKVQSNFCKWSPEEFLTQNPLSNRR